MVFASDFCNELSVDFKFLLEGVAECEISERATASIASPRIVFLFSAGTAFSLPLRVLRMKVGSLQASASCSIVGRSETGSPPLSRDESAVPS